MRGPRDGIVAGEGARHKSSMQFVSSCGVAGNYEQRGHSMRENELIIAMRVRLDLCGMRSRDAAVAVKLPSAVGYGRGWRIQVGSFEEEKFS
jgi:hypothetical protein